MFMIEKEDHRAHNGNYVRFNVRPTSADVVELHNTMHTTAKTPVGFGEWVFVGNEDHAPDTLKGCRDYDDASIYLYRVDSKLDNKQIAVLISFNSTEANVAEVIAMSDEERIAAVWFAGEKAKLRAAEMARKAEIRQAELRAAKAAKQAAIEAEVDACAVEHISNEYGQAFRYVGLTGWNGTAKMARDLAIKRLSAKR